MCRAVVWDRTLLCRFVIWKLRENWRANVCYWIVLLGVFGCLWEACTPKMNALQLVEWKERIHTQNSMSEKFVLWFIFAKDLLFVIVIRWCLKVMGLINCECFWLLIVQGIQPCKWKRKGTNGLVIRSFRWLELSTKSNLKKKRRSEISAQEISKNLSGNLKIENSFLWANAES